MLQWVLTITCATDNLSCTGSMITEAYYSNYNNYYNEPWHIYHINCNGTENSLFDCAMNQINTCRASTRHATVACSGK